jgi:hypothetical protein
MTPRTFFPGRLMRAVNHAESFCVFLSRIDCRHFDVTARAWLLGRRREVASYVDQIGRDYRQKRLSEAEASACIEAYLAALHAGVGTHFGERSPACCKASVAVTAVAPRPTDNTPTTMYVRPRQLLSPPARPPRPEPARPQRPSFEDSVTWIDVEPDQLLAGLATRPVGSFR